MFELLCMRSFSHLVTRSGCTLSFVTLELSFSQIQLGAAFEPWEVFFVCLFFLHQSHQNLLLLLEDAAGSTEHSG